MEVWWRLGLGWLVGRRWLLVTTTDVRAAVPFRFFAGTFYLRAADAPWLNAAREPAVTIQAWPGPRSMKVRGLEADEEAVAAGLWGDDDELIALSPTGQRSPEMLAPDLIWLWPVALVVLLLGRRLLRDI